MPLRCTLLLHPHRHLLWAAKIVKKTYLGDFLHKKSQISLSLVSFAVLFLPISVSRFRHCFPPRPASGGGGIVVCVQPVRVGSVFCRCEYPRGWGDVVRGLPVRAEAICGAAVFCRRGYPRGAEATRDTEGVFVD